MAMGQHADLESIAEVRNLAARAAEAQRQLAEYSQERVDRVVDAMAAAARAAAEELARLAHEETGFGSVACKKEKNLFCAVRVHEFIRSQKTVGVVHSDPVRKVYEIAEPVGVVAAIVPCTNPTSTTIFKILIAVKARNGIVISPHPAALRCTRRTVEIMDRAARDAGAPAGLIACIEHPTGDGTAALMRDSNVAVILATGGSAMVKAAYSAGKPCFGVGPGNVPVYVHESADLPRSIERVLQGKLFDNGTLCSSEQSIIVDRAVSDAAVRELASRGAHFLSAQEQEVLAAELITDRFTVNPRFVGRPATYIARACGIKVPDGTRVLVAPLRGVGRSFPLSAEKLSPVLAYYVVKDWREGCERCKEVLAFGGAGHTLAVHARDREVIFKFALEKPAFRIIANAPASTGAVGLHTALDPSMTLGCGAMGGNVTSDNISPRHLLNIKRLAFGLGEDAATPEEIPKDESAPEPRAGDLRSAVEEFLAARSIGASCADGTCAHPGDEPERSEELGIDHPEPEDALDFVCEDDVRAAIAAGRKLRVGERTIVTPAARDLGESRGVFVSE